MLTHAIGKRKNTCAWVASTISWSFGQHGAIIMVRIYHIPRISRMWNRVLNATGALPK
jgi:hypothetical protein